MRCAICRSLGGDVEELDGRGLSAIPGLVDCHTHACFAGDRVEEFSLRAAGATYEELHAAAAGSSRRCARRVPPARTGSRRRSSATPGGCSRAGTTTFEAKSGYGLDRETELAQLRAIRAGGGVPTWLGAHAVPPEFEEGGAEAYVDFLLADVLPDAAALAEAADVFLERGAFDVDQARRYLVACRDAGLELRLHGDQFTEAGAIPLAIELGARSVDHLEATGADGVAALAASDVVGVLLPASALFLGRPMPPGRALVDAGAADRARDRLQPRERVLREPAARLLARRDAARPGAGGSPRGVHRQRRPRPRSRSSERVGSPRATTPTSSSSPPTTGATSRTTSVGSVVHTVVRGGRIAWRARA